MRLVYRYRGADADGSIVGTIESTGLDEAWFAVRRHLGIEPKALRLCIVGTVLNVMRGSGPALQDLSRLYQVMADRRQAGLSLSQGLREAMEYSPAGVVVTLLARLRQGLRSGLPLAEAMAFAGFPALDTSAIRAVRHAGAEAGVLRSLAEQAGLLHRLRRRVMSVAAYPMLVAVLAWILAAAITLFIAPRLARFLTASSSMGDSLPGWIDAYYAFAREAGAHPLLFSVLWVGGPLALVLLAGPTLMRGVQHLPGPSRIRHLLDQVSIWQAFARLHEAGVRPAEIFDELAAASSVTLHARQLTLVAAALRTGSLSLARAVRAAGFPAVVVLELSAGESSLNYPAGVARLVELLRERIDRECTGLERLASVMAYALVGGIVVLLASVAVLPQLSAAFSRL
jgi:type II secretory pathway component PulF